MSSPSPSLTPAPLGVLDLVPITSGSDAAAAIRNSLDLVRRVEAAGYHRYWFAEHHLNAGVTSSSPAVMISLAAAGTSRIRLGSGGVQSGHRTALSVVEEFGLIDALYPGRIDLGIGRSGGREYLSARKAARARRAQLGFELLQQEGAVTPKYEDLLRDITGLLAGTYRSADGLNPQPVPGEGAGVEVWVLGSSAGESAAAAGALGLRFAASYHISPRTALEAAEAYRAAFVPSAVLDRPYVAVSADVVVGPDDEAAARLAAGYGLWVLRIRQGEGAPPYPDADEAAAHRWTDEERRLVADRLETRLVGSPATVAAGLARLQAAAGADEVIVTTITHDPADRVRSHELLAAEWYRSGRVRAQPQG